MDALVKCERVCVECAAGDAIIFDYRTLHRGTANVSQPPHDRPLLCLVFARRWFMDADNYPRQGIGDVSQHRQEMVRKLSVIFSSVPREEAEAVLRESEWQWTEGYAALMERKRKKKRAVVNK